MDLIDLVNSVIIFQIIIIIVMIIISNDLTQMVNFSTWISPTLLNFFLFSDASICSTMAFPLYGNSGHIVVSVSIDFPSYSQWDAPFPCITYDYSRADWDGLCDHSEMFHGSVSLYSVLLLLLVNFVSGFRLELTHIFLKESITSSLTYLHGFQMLVLLP